MKKINIRKNPLFIIFFICTLHIAYGQDRGLENSVPDTNASTMLNLREYSRFFLNPAGTISRTYTRAVSSEDELRLGALSGDLERIDTPLEIALLSNAAGVVNIRPVQANEMLGTPRQAALKFGAAVLMEIRVLSFLGNTRAVGVHETELKFIIDNNGVTRAEVETFYRNGIRDLISGIVDEEFNKISLMIRQQDSSYGGVLTRNTQNGHYELSYEGYFNGTRQINELSGQTLEALLSALSSSGEFSQAAINTVRAQAALIPAVALSNAALNEVKTILTAFYTNPTVNTYNAVRDIATLYRNTYISTRNAFFLPILASHYAVLSSLNNGLRTKVEDEANSAARITLTQEQQQRLVQLM